MAQEWKTRTYAVTTSEGTFETRWGTEWEVEVWNTQTDKRWMETTTIGTANKTGTRCYDHSGESFATKTGKAWRYGYHNISRRLVRPVA